MDDNNINLRLIEKVEQLESRYGRKFSNTQKILLSTDGSITAILDVLYGKIDFTTIEQHIEKASKEVAEHLNIKEGNEVASRIILMHKGNKPLIHALSYIPLERLSEDMELDLRSGEIPIGRILKKYQVESRREIKNIHIEKPNKFIKEIFNTDEDVLTRDYDIIKDGKIFMWIEEIFPVSYFNENISEY
ncbi:chorismate--pyruvate lyase family protein [Methanobrevibacter sp.]